MLDHGVVAHWNQHNENLNKGNARLRLRLFGSTERLQKWLRVPEADFWTESPRFDGIPDLSCRNSGLSDSSDGQNINPDLVENACASDSVVPVFGKHGLATVSSDGVTSREKPIYGPNDFIAS